MKRLVTVVSAVGLMVSGLLASPGSAAPASPERTVAAVLTCNTGVVGILPNGRLVERHVTNARVTGESQSAKPLPFPVDYMFGRLSEPVVGGYVASLYMFHAGAPARFTHVTTLTADPRPTVSVVGRYRPTMKARTLADSGRYYTYGVDPHGHLMRWTKYTDNAGHYWFDNKPVLVEKHAGSLKTLSYSIAIRLADGIRKDLLYGTTTTGALKQYQIPWGAPGKAKITTLKTSGFESYTSLSNSYCNRAATIGSLVAIDKVHNQARWFTINKQFAPKGSNVVRHQLIAPGANWRLHATF